MNLNGRIEVLEGQYAERRAAEQAATISASADWVEANASPQELTALHRMFSPDIQLGDEEVVAAMVHRMPVELWPWNGEP